MNKYYERVVDDLNERIDYLECLEELAGKITLEAEASERERRMWRAACWALIVATTGLLILLLAVSIA